MDKFQKYVDSYEGQNLLKKHNLDEIGIWEIRGEDGNTSLNGPYYQPYLDLVSGKLSDAIAYAIELKGFYTWGRGGTFTKRTIRKV